MGVQHFGARVARFEDPALLSGKGRYIDDIAASGAWHADFVRSPHPHAAIRKLDAAAALALPGVQAVLTVQPSACTASVRQERAERPSIRTVHAPQTPCSQPRCVPVRPSSCRRKSARVMRTGTERRCSRPFTVKLMSSASLMPPPLS